ncbi:MAG: sensor histidine kinase [Caldilineaceae bacterium]|nr:sensor histidine kinase [Caldilineaceae bacterium]
MQLEDHPHPSDEAKFTWMDWVGVGTMVVITFFAFNLYPADDVRRWPTLGLLLLITLLQIWPREKFRTAHYDPRKEHLRFVVLTGLSLLTVWLDVNYTAVVILFFVFSGRALVLFPSRIGYSWVFFWGILITWIMTWGLYPNWPAGLLNGLGSTCGFFFVGSAANAQRRAEMATAELQLAHRQLQAYATSVEALAVSEERNRLAREMHDTLGHRLTVAAVQLEGAQKLISRDPEKAARMVGTVREQVLEGLTELRRTVAALRTPLQEELPLRTALTRLVADFVEATGLAVDLTLPEELPPLDTALRQTLYRTAQEALTNVQRHAQATQVKMTLSLQRDSAVTSGPEGTALQLEVEDNGAGIDASQTTDGFGLRGLAERAAALGGNFLVGQGDGLGGTNLTLRLPIPSSPHHESLPTSVMGVANG